MLLVAVSLILLTDYFGESPSSPLHTVQRGIAAVLSPLQSAASTVLSPVRNFSSSISRTLNAGSQNVKLRAENAAYRNENASLNYYKVQYQRDQKLLGLDTSASLKKDGPVAANVIGYNPSAWYDFIEVDRGSDSGVHIYDPVVSGGGLVGDVTEVGTNYSLVTLITSPKFAVGAMVEDGSNDAGVLQPAVGNQGALVLSSLPSTAKVAQLQMVVTSGFSDPANPAIHSYYPAGIPIGQVSNQDASTTVVTSQQVNVTPFVDLTHLSVVQILTRPRL